MTPVPFATARAMAAARMLSQADLAQKAGRDKAAMEARVRAASMRAPLAYPGIVGALLSDELDAYAKLPFLWGSPRMTRLMDDVLTRPVPQPKASR